MTKKTKITILISALSVAAIALIVFLVITLTNKDKTDTDIKPVGTVSSDVSSNTSSEIAIPEIDTSSEIVVPAIDTSSKAVVNEDTDKAEDMPLTSSTPPATNVDVTETVDKPVEPTKAEWKETAFEKTMYTNADCSSRQKPIKGSAVIKKYAVNTEVKVVAKTDTEYYKLDNNSFIHRSFLSDKKTEIKQENNNGGMPQPNPDLAKPANRNMPSFTIDTSVQGPQGTHGQTGPCNSIGCIKCSGTHYYHAGCDAWMPEEYFFAFRYGQHPEASDYNKSSPQVSPHQQDGDYDPYNASGIDGVGCYYCKACNGWIHPLFWEDGRHFTNNKNH